jgi:hypothetical protein
VVSRAPRLHDVLVHVQPGRTVRLHLTDQQKAATSDRDGLILRQVIRALLHARHEATDQPPYSFPLTEHTFCAIARRLGTPVGVKRARRLIRRGIACDLLLDSGSFRSRYKKGGDGGGHRVRLFKLGCRIVGLRSALRPHSAVGTSRVVKGADRVEKRPFWAHDLFGSPDWLPPPEAQGKSRRAKRLQRWRETKGCPQTTHYTRV